MGTESHHKLGDYVKDDEPILIIHSNRQEIPNVGQLLKEDIKVSDGGRIPTLTHGIIE